LGIAFNFGLFRFPVDRMSVAISAEFLHFQALGIIILAACGRIIAGTALCTSKRYLFSHEHTP
jgi:hypothetical protein